MGCVIYKLLELISREADYHVPDSGLTQSQPIVEVYSCHKVEQWTFFYALILNRLKIKVMF